jgi:hypothetical protein
MKSALINIWFSNCLPDYFDFFCKSCEINEANFDWYIFTNLTNSKKQIRKNIFLLPYSWEEMIKEFDINSEPDLNLLRIWPKNGWPYRMLLYKRKIWDSYDFLGTFDIDVIYGNLMEFMPKNPFDYCMITPHSGKMTPNKQMRNCAPFCLYKKNKIDLIWEYLEKREDALDDNYLFAKFIKERCSIATPLNLQPIGDSLPMGDANMINLNCLWKNGEIYVEGIRGGFFHLLPFKFYNKFKIKKNILSNSEWLVSKYGIRSKINLL